MLTPDFKEFQRLAKEATLVPVVKSVHADLLTPVSAFLSFAADEPNAILLESVEGGEKIGRYALLGAPPYMVWRAGAQGGEIERGKKIERRKGSVFQILRELLREHKPAHIPGLPPFIAGAVGFFAYDTVRQLEPIPTRAKSDLKVPNAAFMFFDRLLAFDHVRHQIHIIAAADVRKGSLKQAYDRAARDIAAIEKKLADGKSAPHPETARKTKAPAGKRPSPTILTRGQQSNNIV